MSLRYEELTYKIRSCIYEVRNEIGSGYDEKTYHQGLLLSFQRNAIPFISKEKRTLLHNGVLIRNFINDFLLYNKIILSIKCVPCKFLQAHYVQLFSELKLWKKDLGLLVNFGLPNIEIERYAFDEKEPVFVENYNFIQGRIDNEERHVLKRLRLMIKDVASFHKPGHSKIVWRKIIESEMKHQQIPFSKNETIPVTFYGKTIRTYRLRHFIIDNKILLQITALQKGIDQIDVSNMQSYLKALKLNSGLIVNFGKAEVQISGIRAPA